MCPRCWPTPGRARCLRVGAASGSDRSARVTGTAKRAAAAASANVSRASLMNGCPPLTAWSTHANSGGGMLAMKVYRQVGDTTYMVVGRDGPRTLMPGVLNTFAGLNIPVKPGDVLGNSVPSAGGAPGCDFAAPGDSYRFRNGNLLDGEAGDFPFVLANFRVNVSAVVEPDCDNDGLGDETQDPNLSTCAPGTIPPPAPGAAQATCRGLPATIVATGGSDVRTGSQGRDVVAGLGGNDTLSGIAGNDVVCGGAGKDTLRGGKGKDTLLGQKGKDALTGGGGKDLCKGGKGTDTASKCEVEKSI
jgi:RTX calcium-binding nonapeptide repeat (4 copies)